jgi:hypothetical protein
MDFVETDEAETAKQYGYVSRHTSNHNCDATKTVRCELEISFWNAGILQCDFRAAFLAMT